MAIQFEDFHSGKWHCGGDYPKVFVTKVSTKDFVVYVWVSNVNIDFDGASNAYGPAGKGALDELKHAGNAAQGWFGLASYSEAERDQINAQLLAKKSNQNILLDTGPGLGLSTRLSGRHLLDPKGKKFIKEPQIRFPVIQQRVNGDPNPGLYVSATSHVANRALPEWKQLRYVDASAVPFGALSGKLRTEGNVDLGDYALAIRLGGAAKTCAFSFMDSGGKNSYAVGECSHKVLTELGGIGKNNNFINGFLVFSESRKWGPKMKEEIQAKIKGLSVADGDQLAMLIGFCAQAGKGGSGLKLWQAHQTNPSGGALPRPSKYDDVVKGLRTWGYTG